MRNSSNLKKPSLIRLIFDIIATIADFFRHKKQSNKLIEKEKIERLNEKLKSGYESIDNERKQPKEKEDVEVLSDRLNNRF